MSRRRNEVRRTEAERYQSVPRPPKTIQEAIDRAGSYAMQKGGVWYAFVKQNDDCSLAYDVSPESPRDPHVQRVYAIQKLGKHPEIVASYPSVPKRHVI